MGENKMQASSSTLTAFRILTEFAWKPLLGENIFFFSPVPSHPSSSPTAPCSERALHKLSLNYPLSQKRLIRNHSYFPIYLQDANCSFLLRTNANNRSTRQRVREGKAFSILLGFTTNFDTDLPWFPTYCYWPFRGGHRIIAIFPLQLCKEAETKWKQNRYNLHPPP